MAYYVPADRSADFSDLLLAGIERITIECTRCERRGEYSVRRAIDRYGNDLGRFLSDLRESCPTSREPGVYGVCAACCPDLAKLHPPLTPYVPRPDRGPR